MTRNLVISPIGDNSKHRTWIEGPGSPNFDMFLIYYGDGPDSAAGDAKYYLRNKGFKWEHIHLVADKHRDTLRQYDYIWCPDDDIACDTAGVNKLFEIVRKYNVQLAQPAISAGEFAFKGLIQQRGNILRYSPYVEVMCPIFTQAAFFKLQDTFLENRSAWGLDWIWPKAVCTHRNGHHRQGRRPPHRPAGKRGELQTASQIGNQPLPRFRGNRGPAWRHRLVDPPPHAPRSAADEAHQRPGRSPVDRPADQRLFALDGAEAIGGVKSRACGQVMRQGALSRKRRVECSSLPVWAPGLNGRLAAALAAHLHLLTRSPPRGRRV